MYRWVLLTLAYACIVTVLMAPRVGSTTQTAGSPPTASPESPVKAKALLDDAAWYIEVKDPASARQQILAALAAARTDEGVRKRAGELWAQAREQAAQIEAAKTAEQEKKEAEQQEKTKQNHHARLDEAARKATRGENDAAASTALDILKETKDKEITQRARALLENNRPGTSAVLGKSFYTIWGWALSVFAVALVLLALRLLLRAWRHVWATSKNYSWRRIGGYVFSHWRQSNSFREAERKAQEEHKELRRWIVVAINDTTTLGVAEAVTTSLSRWKESSAPASAGLLRLETLQLPSVPQLELPQVQVDLTPALEALPLTIGGINLGTVGKAVAPLQNWFGAKRLWIRGSASKVGTRVIVRLTRRNANDTTETVNASADEAQSVEAAESASFKMYYLIAKESSVPNADAADKLRNGLKLLGQYVSGRDPKQLEAAYKALREARSENPVLFEAYLYEGVALDIMERHEEAAKRFEFIIGSDAEEAVKRKAKYNKAVSLFRGYRPEKLDEAIELLGELSRPEGGAQPPAEADVVQALIASPIKALASAAQANAVAHKPIFWRHYAGVPEGADEETIKRYKAAAQRSINEWMQVVATITTQLNTILADARTKAAPWDANTRQQLKWAVQNAIGNAHLNCAAKFYLRPYVAAGEAELREQALEAAYDAFQQCEMLLPPGVETLTNLATVLMELRRGEDSRCYSLKAIDLNPDYEYAYYRLAQAWERDGRMDELVKVLRLFAKDNTPRIPSFQSLYSRHAVELAKFFAGANGDTPPPSTPQPAPNTAVG